MDGFLLSRHIQDHNQANTTTRKYWGYPDRILPCTKDVGTCEYLDAVYRMHDTSMLYTFILWGVILGVLMVMGFDRFRRLGVATQGRGGLFDEIADRLDRLKRSLLPDAPMAWLFGRISRLQVVVLCVILVYLLIFSLIGIVYQTWVTPISGSNLFNTRTGLGGWSDRIGALAYALTPLAVMLCQRESVLSIITSIPYQHFNFLHRWLGRIIFIQSALHTLGWTIVEAKLYQPQPSIYADFMKQQYVIFGVFAMFFITWLTVFSSKTMIKWTGYEFFKVTHWIVAVLYVAACWGHWDKLYCWMVPSLALIFLDQAVRYGRTAYMHYTGSKGGTFGFKAVDAQMTVLTDDNGTVIRLEMDHEGRPWQAGQHFFLTFPSISIWQSHPFTVSSLPEHNEKTNRHMYLIRVRDGLTKNLAALGDTNFPVILTGPYGPAFPQFQSQHVLAVSGGTGVTFTLPIIMAALQQCMNRQAVLDFVWVVRKSEDVLWLKTEIHQLRKMLADFLGLRITIFISRESSKKAIQPDDNPDVFVEPKGKEKVETSVCSVSSDISLEDLLSKSHPRFRVHFLKDHHPSVADVVADFRERSADIGGSVEIVGSGPEAMGSDLRAAVAVEEGDGVSFYWDSRG